METKQIMKKGEKKDIFLSKTSQTPSERNMFNHARGIVIQLMKLTTLKKKKEDQERRSNYMKLFRK